MTASNPRQLAFVALRHVYRRGAYADAALAKVLATNNPSNKDRGLVTELVYGIVRRVRSLDALIDQLGSKTAIQQPPDLRIILHIGLYQLRYLSQVPAAAAVNTSVQLAKDNGLNKLSKVVNGILRQYERLAAKAPDPLAVPTEPILRLGILYSFPDWIVENWLEQISIVEAEQLCAWFNQPPTIDLRVNLLKKSLEEVESALVSAGIAVSRLHLPQALRLTSPGSIQQLPGFEQGWWTVQDSSAQLVTHLLDPQPGEVVIDACAAPGGKTTHIAELMKDRGEILAFDRAASRLGKLQENIGRLQLKSITVRTTDSRHSSPPLADRVLIDAPCSGLGTLHRRPDIRWRQTPQKIQELSRLQRELLERAATWVKPEGTLVYATCTLNRLENEEVIQSFLDSHAAWQIEVPPLEMADYATSSGFIKVWPHRHHMDGFFMVKLKKFADFNEKSTDSPTIIKNSDRRGLARRDCST